MLRGIDVSYSQGEINWLRVRSAGIDFAIIRAGYGCLVSQIDSFFEKNINGAIRAGIKIGIYWFGYPTPDESAEEEFNACKKVIESYLDKIEFIAYDYEQASFNYYVRTRAAIPSVKFINDSICTFLDNVLSIGKKAVVYSCLSYFRNYILPDTQNKYVPWIADYNGENSVYPIQQISDNGKIDGIATNVDIDIIHDETLLSEPVDITYAVRADERILPDVRNLNDFAGTIAGNPITDFKCNVSRGTVSYQVHDKNGVWLPLVTGSDWNDDKNGYAGNHHEIDAIRIIYNGNGKRARYRVANSTGNYFDWQYNDEENSNEDGYAGKFGTSIYKIQVCIE